MSKDLSPEDEVVLDRLLTETARRLDGAVDLWTVVCLGEFPLDRHGFVLEHCQTLRAFVVVLRTVLAESDRAGAEPVRGFLETMFGACEKLQKAFLVLEQFRIVSLEELREATAAVTEVYTELRESIRQLGLTIGVSVSYWQSLLPGHEEYFQRILGSLFALFCQQRGSEEPKTAVSSSEV